MALKQISLAKLDALLKQDKITKEDYIDQCSSFFEKKREKYRATYYKRRARSETEDTEITSQIELLKIQREKLIIEKKRLNEEIHLYRLHMSV